MNVPLATALRDSFRSGYDLKALKSDVAAALVVSLVALPLAMALSIAVGLPPQNGPALAGLTGTRVRALPKYSSTSH